MSVRDMPAVMIVGAGPTGLALACQLLRAGVSIRIIEKRAGPSQTSRAIGLQYRVSEILACMGVADRFLARGGSPTTVNIYHGAKRLVALQFRGEGRTSGKGAFSPQPIMIAQSETEAILDDRLHELGGVIEWNTELLGFVQYQDKVTVRLRMPAGQEELLPCQWLVSCEGAHSLVRNQAGMTFEGKTYPLAFLMADVELTGDLDHEQNHVWVHPDGSFAALPFPKPGRWRLFIELTRAGESLTGTPGLAVIDEIMRQRVGKRELKISNPDWISPFFINCRMVNRYRVGRVFVAGDAAHIHSPTGGQGIATGIQDAANLAWKLARVIQGAPAFLLDTYDEERRAKAKEVLRETNRTTMIFFAPTRAMQALRDFVVLPLLRSPWVQKRMFSKLSQLHVAYRDSRLSQHDDRHLIRRTRIRAGDRAPDILFRDLATGEATTLFKMLEPLRPVALISANSLVGAEARVAALTDQCRQSGVDAYWLTNNAAQVASENVNCLFDIDGEFATLYGMIGEFLCLIRPDDHVGLFQRPIDEERLAGYLKTMDIRTFARP